MAEESSENWQTIKDEKMRFGCRLKPWIDCRFVDILVFIMAHGYVLAELFHSGTVAMMEETGALFIYYLASDMKWFDTVELLQKPN